MKYLIVFYYFILIFCLAFSDVLARLISLILNDGRLTNLIISKNQIKEIMTEKKFIQIQQFSPNITVNQKQQHQHTTR